MVESLGCSQKLLLRRSSLFAKWEYAKENRRSPEALYDATRVDGASDRVEACLLNP